MLKALDPGTRRLGWAMWGNKPGPSAGFYDLRCGTEGETYLLARKLMRNFINPGDIVALEAPLLIGKASIASRLALFGVRAHILAVAVERRAEVKEVAIDRWRNWGLGVTRAPTEIKGVNARRKWLKGRARQEVAARGWGDVTDDEAEAMLMACWLRAQVDYDYAFRTRPALARPA